MDIHAVGAGDQFDDDAVVVAPFFEGDTAESTARYFRAGADRAGSMVEAGAVRTQRYECTLLHATGDQPAVLFVGGGPREEADAFLLKRVAAAAARYLTARGYSRAAFVDTGVVEPELAGRAYTEGAVYGPYDPGLRKSARSATPVLQAITLVGSEVAALQRGAHLGQIVGESENLARDLVNLPPNDLTPTIFAERAQAVAGQHGLQCEVLDEAALAQLGMGAILGVAAGSAQPPRVIILRYGEADAATRVAFVGKGITFDSGGLSLKPAEAMVTMKGDMGGAAAVLAGMAAIARLGIDGLSVAGYIASSENMPGGNAMRVGDVLTAFNGETIEVLNTDAEGRLVLADVLSYAKSNGATHIVDFATLTGGAVISLGSAATLAAGKPFDWVERAVAAGRRGLERVWPMPLYEEYRRAMDSDVADIKNTGGREGSALTAAAFLSDFTSGVQWAHMDIAGTSWQDRPTPYRPTGGTGAGVGTIVELALELSREAAQGEN